MLTPIHRLGACLALAMLLAVGAAGAYDGSPAAATTAACSDAYVDAPGGLSCVLLFEASARSVACEGPTCVVRLDLAATLESDAEGVLEVVTRIHGAGTGRACGVGVAGQTVATTDGDCPEVCRSRSVGAEERCETTVDATLDVPAGSCGWLTAIATGSHTLASTADSMLWVEVCRDAAGPPSVAIQ